MKKHLKRAAIAIGMSVMLIVGELSGSGVVLHAKTTAEDRQMYSCWMYILKEGKERPGSIDEISSSDFNWGDIGSVSKRLCATSGEYGEEKFEDMEVQLPYAARQYLKENEEIRWFASKPVGYRIEIYGEVVEKQELQATPQMHSCWMYILKDGKERPGSIDEISKSDFNWGDIGSVSKKLCATEGEYGEEKFENMEAQLPYAARQCLGENEEIKWFASKPVGHRIEIYGEVVEKQEILVIENSIATEKPVATATLVATEKPTVTETPDLSTCCRTGFNILPIEEDRPENMSELDSVDWEWGDYGYATKGEEIYNQEIMEKRVVKSSYAVDQMLNEDENIHWFAMKKKGYGWCTYGEIYNVNVENSIANGAIESKKTEITVNTVADIEKLNKVYENGTKIHTLGFYKAGDGGAATYEIALRSNGKTFSTFVTTVGQYANLVVTDQKINLKQLGAGTCEEIIYNTSSIEYNDDAARLNEAIALIDAYDGGVIYIPEGNYRCASKVNIGGDHYSIVGEGSKSLLYTDNGYKGDEHFLTICGQDITLDGFRVEAHETKWVPYYRQCSVMFASDIQILNCEFSVQKNVIAYNGDTDRQYTNITLYTGWHNVKIDNCIMEQMGCVERGACLGIIDMWSNGCSDVSVTNCVMKQNAHDEMLGIFTKTGATAAIENVYIANNEMYTTSASNVTKKTMAITVGYDDSIAISNVRIVNNHVTADIPSNFMTFGKVTDCVVENNVFDVNHTGTGTGGVVFDARKNVTIRNNEVNVRSDLGGGVTQVFKRYGSFENNEVTCSCYVYMVSYCGGKMLGNHIVLAKGCHAVATSPEEFSDNTVESKGEIGNFISYDGLEFDSTISNNTFYYDYDDTNNQTTVSFNGYFIFAGFHAGINDHIVKVSDNTIYAADTISSKNKGMLCYGISDDTPQVFILENNNVGVYKWVRSLYGQSIENVVFSDNVGVNGEKLTLSNSYVGGFENVK